MTPLLHSHVVSAAATTQIGRAFPHELDHVYPASRGGRSDADNLTVACRPCNRSKGARTPEEWLHG